MKILKELREAADMTLRQVEESTGISNAYLSQLETGKIKKPSANALYKLALLYSVDIETLLIKAGMIREQTEIIPALMRPTIEHRLNDIERRLKNLESRSFLHEPLI